MVWMFNTVSSTPKDGAPCPRSVYLTVVTLDDLVDTT